MLESTGRLHLLYNPFAGRRKMIRSMDEVIKLMQGGGYAVSVHRASSPQDIEKVSAGAADADVLVVAGGDGTIHWAVNGLMKLPEDRRPRLGILPVGTANDLAYALKLPKTIPEACRTILNGRTIAMDVGKVNDRYFVNVASAGFLTDVSPKVDIKVKNSLGQLAYYLKGLESLSSFRSFQVTYLAGDKPVTEEVVLLLAVNGLSVGGLRNMVPGASLTDGKLDVIMVRQSGWPEAIRLLLRALRGEKMNGDRIIQLRTDQLAVECDREVGSDLDGEWGPNSPWQISVGPKIAVFA